MATKSSVKKSTTSNNKKATATKSTKPATAKKPAAAKKPVAASKPAAAKKPAVRAKKGSKRVPAYADISQKAHEIYQQRMATGTPGNQDSDWYQAVDHLQSAK